MRSQLGKSIAIQIWMGIAIFMGLVLAVAIQGLHALRELDRHFIALIVEVASGRTPEELDKEILRARETYDGAFTAECLLLLLTFGIGTVIAWSASRRISRPIVDVTRVVREIAGGDLSRRVPLKDLGGEIGDLAESVNRMAAEIDRTLVLLEKAYQDLKDTHRHLVQSEKLISLGQLVAGVAHELNNPMTFIYGNLDRLEEYHSGLKQLLDAWEASVPLEPSQVSEIKVAIDYDFVLIDLAKIVKSCRQGAQRAKRIVSDLKTFARPDDQMVSGWDLNSGLEATLSLCAGQYSHRITFKREYGIVRPITASPQLAQVFLNLIVNACQAIPDRGTLILKTWEDNRAAYVQISDTGSGIPEEIRDRIFDPFFTTKKVGEGTGLGLSISYGIVEKHGGRIVVDSELGQGTVFEVDLPFQPLAPSIAFSEPLLAHRTEL